MVKVVTGISLDEMSMASRGMLSRDSIDFFKNRIADRFERAGRRTSKYLEAAVETTKNLNFDILHRKLELVRRKANASLEDLIVPLTDIASIRTATSKMRRYIMADTRVRMLWYKGMLEGYGDLYNDDEKGCVGEDHSTYRKIYQGMQKEVGDEVHFTTYFDVLEDDEDLSLEERLDIIETHEAIHRYLDQGLEDPTSPTGNTTM